MNGRSLSLQGHQLIGRSTPRAWQMFAAAATFEQGAFSGAIRVAELDAHQKAVKLRFRQRKRSDLADGFCVAITKKGSGSGRVSPSTVT